MKERRQVLDQILVCLDNFLIAQDIAEKSFEFRDFCKQLFDEKPRQEGEGYELTVGRELS